MNYCVHCGELLPKNDSSFCYACKTAQNSEKNEGDYYNIKEIPFANEAEQDGFEKPYKNSYAAIDENSITFGNLDIKEINNTKYSNEKKPLKAVPISEIDSGATRMMSPLKSGKPTGKLQSSKTKIGTKQFDNKQSRNMKIALIALIISLVLLIAALATALYMSSVYDINDDFLAIKNALLQGDSTTLKSMMYSDEIDIANADISSLMRAFSSEDKVNILMSQIANDIENPGTAPSYTAFYAYLEDAPFGYNRLKLGVKPVSIQVNTNTENSVVNINGVAATPSQQSPLTFSGLVPGVYTVVVRGQTQIGQTVEGDSIDVEALNSDTPAVFDGALPISDVTVSGTLSDAAIIFVNGTQVSQVPVNGVVSLPQLLVGSNISMEFTSESGAVITSSVQFNDRSITSLEFTNHTLAGGIPTHAQIESIFSTFFASYLNAYNLRDINLLKNASPERVALMTNEITAEKQNVSTLTSTSVSPTNIQETLTGTVPTIIFNAHALYSDTTVTTDEDGNSQTNTTQNSYYYTIELIYSSQTWVVNKMAFATKEMYDAGQFAALG